LVVGQLTMACGFSQRDRQKNTQGEELILALHARAGVLDDLPERMAQAMRDHLRMLGKMKSFVFSCYIEVIVIDWGRTFWWSIRIPERNLP